MKTLKSITLWLGMAGVAGSIVTAAAQLTNAAASQARTVKPDELRLNFRAAPLECILSYLSDAAGFVIDLRTDLKGKATVWSSQPVTKDEAIDLVNAALDQNGYAAVRNGRTLTIYTKDEARKRNLPVKIGNKPEDIPRNGEMVTQIIPVHFISAVQVARDLQTLKPDSAAWNPNEGGNALIVTDTQANIRHLTEILKVLDNALLSVSSIRVFPLKHADAKSLASVVKDLFAPQEGSRDSATSSPGGGRVVNELRGSPADGGAQAGFGPGGPGGFGSGAGAGSFGDRGGAGSARSSTGGAAPTPRVVAVAEERSNSLVVSAPSDQLLIIEGLVRQVDVDVQGVTELRVFHLKHADAQETADLLSNLFADDTSSSSQGSRSQVQFGDASFAGNSAGQGARSQAQSHVVVVPDLRTGSVIVSAARDLMGPITKVIADLDADPAKKQQVFVFSVQNSDAQSVQEILQSLFPAANGTSSGAQMKSGQQNGVGSQLSNRATQKQNQRTGTGSAALGSRSGAASGLGSTGSQ